MKVVRVDARGIPIGPTNAAAWNAERILLDSHRPGRYGGTGQSYDWASVRPYAGRALLAGGLSPANVGEALRLARPWASSLPIICWKTRLMSCGRSMPTRKAIRRRR